MQESFVFVSYVARYCMAYVKFGYCALPNAIIHGLWCPIYVSKVAIAAKSSEYMYTVYRVPMT